jgi:hypothetical protein
MPGSPTALPRRTRRFRTFGSRAIDFGWCRHRRVVSALSFTRTSCGTRGCGYEVGRLYCVLFDLEMLAGGTRHHPRT